MLGFLRKKRARKIYLHEAAHAITAVHYGIPVKQIIVYPDRQPDGTIADTVLDLKNEAGLSQDSLRALVITALAGAVVDKQIRIDPSYHQFDLAVARDYANKINDKYSIMEGKLTAREIVDSHWDAITALASDLETCDGLVTGDRVKEIYHDNCLND